MSLEIELFQTLWKGGYYEGNPLDPLSPSSYSQFDIKHGYLDQRKHAQANGIRQTETGYISTIYAVYLICIRPHVNPNTTVLEIGPGRGAWSKAIMTHNPKHLYALDALSAEHNAFFKYVSPASNITYTQVKDFSCPTVPDNSIDFFFSFGAFCHMSRASTVAYFDTLADKMKPGSHGYIMITDYDKFDKVYCTYHDKNANQDPDPTHPGRWHHHGEKWFCDMILKRGFKVIDSDIGVTLRDVIVHFAR